ncbi:exodeoxyribonuclease III [Methanocella sp. MCL-LM]|uniref:exodeoxyribonuclease III n=1 Tax=Methanocella sp. MCL-LM TaxID=3412035 RepID=UPI003C77A019
MTELEILSWNVNGLRAILKKGFIDFLQEKNPDILCLQETKASEDQLPPEIRTAWGYHVYFASGEKKGYSGVAILSKVKPLSVSAGFGIEEFDREGRVLVADYGSFVLLNIYFPNGKASPERLDYKMRFYDAFLEYVDRLKARGRKIVVCGDVNTAHREIDIARPRENSKISGFLPVERAWMDKFFAHGYVDTFRLFNDQPGQYTFWDVITKARERNVGWRIDYFFVSDNLKGQLKRAYIMPEIMGSDHCPIGIRIDA